MLINNRCNQTKKNALIQNADNRIKMVNKFNLVKKLIQFHVVIIVIDFHVQRFDLFIYINHYFVYAPLK